jgi:predicted nucleic acid-binding protein
MFIVDTSVWVEHFRSSQPELKKLLSQGRVLAHPFVTGELALGNLRKRDNILDAIQNLPQSIVADNNEVLAFIDTHDLAGQGIG